MDKKTDNDSSPLVLGDSEQKAPQKVSPASGMIEITSRVPFPQQLKNVKTNKQFRKFLEVFKQLHINIPFTEALEQMPSYAKFLKDILSHKRKIEDYGMIALIEECSAIIQWKLPQKLKNPGSFTVPCSIGDSVFGKALCDLGANINLMPLSIFQKLGLGEGKPMRVVLQMENRSIKHPRGVIEDVRAKVHKFIFLVNFVVLDMAEDRDIPIILGRPFLATGGALIDFQRGELKLCLQDEEVTFNVFNSIKYQKASDDIFRIDSLDSVVDGASIHSNDPLEVTLLSQEFSLDFDSSVQEYSLWMDLFEPNQRNYFESLGEPLKCVLPSIESLLTLELKPLPSHFSYAFIGANSTVPVIIADDLSKTEEHPSDL